ncbi:MAG: acyl-CoA thioesterase [Myxococcota bacterium]|nr:acyl-CoA thioesterase [Myxococcota bacterium]MDW8363057.1 acyl-CoA thioesterase [Myxococcales bacterium]
MSEPVHEFVLRLPRYAFGPRDACRAADVWRFFQEAAVEASCRAGFPPERYRASGTAFVVREMIVRHLREAGYGEQTRARTWVSRFRRDVFSTREVRMLAADGSVLAAGTQLWAHVRADLRPVRASAELLAAFPVHEEGPSVELPSWEPVDSNAVHELRFRCWHTWMDPLGHVNHPAYIDWADEATSRVMAAAGLSPAALQPVAERAVFRAGVTDDDEVRVRSRCIGRTAEGDVVVAHEITTHRDVRAADVVTVRRLAGADAEALVRAWARAG